jgi:hypothetical protein
MKRTDVLLAVFASFLALGLTSPALGEPPQIGGAAYSYSSSVMGIPVRVDVEYRQISRDGEHHIIKSVDTYTNLQTGQTVEIRGRYYDAYVVVDDGEIYMIQLKRRGNAQLFVAGDVVPFRSGYLEITETYYHGPPYNSYEVKFVGLDATADFYQELYRLLSL